MAENAVVGALRVFLGLDSAEFETGLKRANDNAQSFGGKVKKTLGRGMADIEGQLQSTAGRAGVLGDALSGLGLVGAGVAAGLVVAFAGARDAMAFGDEIGDTANKLQVTTDYLQEMRFAAHDLGGEFNDADAAIEGFTKKLGDAKSGLSAKAIKPFTALGLDPKSFDNVQDGLNAVIGKISGLKDVALQASLADKLGLTPMLPAIRAGGDAIDDLRKKAHDLGYVMDSALIERAGAANDEFEDLQQILSVQFKSAMVEAIPLVMTLMHWMVDGAKAAGNLARKLTEVGDGLAWMGTHSLNGERVQTDLERMVQDQNNRAARKLGLNTTKVLPNAVARASDLSAVRTPPKFKPETTLAPMRGPGDGGAGKAARRAEASEEAIYQASREELAARMALTADIAQLAALRLKEVDDETKREVARLNAEASEGKITKAAAELAVAKLGEAASAKKAKIDQDMAADLDREWIEQKQAINGYYDQIGSIEAGLARTAQERGAIEVKALAARQKAEAEALEVELSRKVAADAGFASAAAAQRAALADRQAAERRQQVEQARVAVLNEAAQVEQSALQNQIDLLSVRSDQAKTGIERRAIEEKILDLEGQLERAQLNEVLAVNGAASIAGQIAQARLAILDQLKPSQQEQDLARLQGSYDDLTDAFDDARRGLESEDWGQAVGGLFSALRTMKKALGNGATAMDKLGAVAALASVVGSAVGGKAGGALSGAASGAMAGAAFGPWGALAGGVIGGLGGLFGASKAKKRAKAEAAAKAAAEAQAKAQQIANEHRQLEIALLEATGKTLEAEAERRKDALAAMDESNRAIQQQVWDAEDLAKAQADATEKARATAEARDEIQDRIDETTLSSAELEAKTRAEQRAAYIAINPELAEMVDRMFALEDAQKAAVAEAEAASQAHQEQLRIEAQLADKAAQALAAASDAQSGLINGLAGMVDGYEHLAKTMDDLADSLGVGLALDGGGQSGLDLARARVMTASNDDVEQAVQDFLDLAKARSSSREDYRSAVEWAQGMLKQRAAASRKSAATIAGWFADAPRFANGGSFEVGGFGGTDSQLVAMRATPGEVVNVTHGGGASMADVVEALNALDARLAKIDRATGRTEKNTYDTQRWLGQVIIGEDTVNIAG